MAVILDIHDVSKRYGDFLLDGVTLRLEEGFIMGLVGPNGAGKTTLIKLILNLIHRDSGSIKIFGEEITSREMEIKQKIGFVLDGPHWYEMMTIGEMVKILSPFYHAWDEKLFADYLHRFGIKAEHKIETLSKGMKMKFSLAVALSHNARLIIMDEPTSGLDPLVRAEVLEILQQLIADENRSILFSSHISTDVEKIADYITFINDGKVVFSDSKENINDKFTLVKGPLGLLDGDTSRCFDSMVKKNTHFTALCTRSEELESRFGSYIKDGNVTVQRAGIDDIMLLMVKGEKHAEPCV